MDINSNWLEKTKVKQFLKESFPKIRKDCLRKALFEYCKIYHEKYYFDILEGAFIYLQYQVEDSIELNGELSVILENVAEGMGEYCLSLNEISSAIYHLLCPEEITFDKAVMIINHVLEAYSCNETAEDFIERESKILYNLFTKLIK